jgi:HEAT repeat protein
MKWDKKKFIQDVMDGNIEQYKPELAIKDPDYVAAIEKQKQDNLARIEQEKKDAAPLLEDLARSGIVVDHLGTLYHKQMHYPEGIPILLKWLPKIQNRSVQNCILLDLCVKWAFLVAWKPLVKAFEDMEGIHPSLRWYVGKALNAMAKESVFEDIYRIVMNRSYGYDRGMVIEAFSRMKNPIVPEALLELLDDESVYAYTISALGKLKVEAARPKLEQLLKHSDSTVRDYAKKALTKLDLQSQKNPKA